MENISQDIDAYLVEHMGSDSRLYGNLNSDQREAIKSVYRICDAYTSLLSGGGEVSKLVAVPPPPAEEHPETAPTKKTNPFFALLLPAVLGTFGALAGGYLWPIYWFSGGICCAVFGGLGAFCVFMMSRRGTGRGEPKPEPVPEPEPAETRDSGSALEQIVTATQELLDLVGSLSRPKSEGHNIQTDSHFAAWVQKVMSAVWNSDDKYLKVLVTDELDTRLSEMGLFVCTEPEMENGRLAEPYDRVFRVKYKASAEPRVTLPAICLGESPVAWGEMILPK